MPKPIPLQLTDQSSSNFFSMAKIPFFNFEALMAAQRKNIEAMTSINQAAFEGALSLMQSQAELLSQSFSEGTNLVQAIMTCKTPEEKAIRQAEASKAAVDKCLANARDITETLTKCNTQAMETVSNRLSEGLQELQEIMKEDKAA